MEKKGNYITKENENSYHVIDESRSNFFMIPNKIEELGLSVYAFRLYAHYKRVTGESGDCWQSSTTLAKSCNMSVGSVVNSRRELEANKLIIVERVTNNNGSDYYNIKVRNIWGIDLAPSPGEHPPSCDEHPPSPGETKNTTIKNTTVKNTTSTRFTKSKASTPKKQRDELISRFKEKTGLDYPEDVPASTLQKFWWTPASDMIKD